MNEEVKKEKGGLRMRSVAPMQIAKIGYLILSVIYCIVGVLFIARSDIGTQVLTRMLGVAMIVFGGVKIVGYFSKDLYRLAFQYDLELGIILAVLGIVVLADPFGTIAFLLIVMGICILADALFKIRIAADAKRFGIEAWWLILILAFLTAVLGLLLAFRPWDSANIMTMLLGIALLSEGVLNFCVALSTVKIVKNQYPDIIDEEYFDHFTFADAEESKV